MHFFRVRRTVAPAVALLCVGCQVYTPVSLTSQRAKDDVRLTLTNDGTVNLARALGVGASELEGRIDAVTDSTIVMRITELTRLTGSDETWSGEPVTIPRASVATVERRTTLVARSVLLGGAIVVGAVLAGTVVGSAEGGSSTGPIKPPK
jgi:hypothetical protein